MTSNPTLSNPTLSNPTLSNPTLSVLDFNRLMPLVAKPVAPFAQPIVDALDEKLASATLLEPRQMPPDVITMNSSVLLCSAGWDRAREYRLVYPTDANCLTGEVSVFSALGKELLAARTGSRLVVGKGPNARIVEVLAISYQPEASGDFDL